MQSEYEKLIQINLFALKKHSLVGCNTIWYGGQILTFRENCFCPSASFISLKMEAAHLYAKLILIYQIMWFSIQNNTNLHSLPQTPNRYGTEPVHPW
jgi:hypothetical protein